jgi:Ca2+-binding RTX toxin-like protein
MSKRSKHTAHSLRVETLEARDVPSTAVLSDGVLTVTGTADANEIGVNRRGHTIIVGDGQQLVGRFAASEVETVVVDAAAGDDVVFIAPNVHADAVVLTGAGNDVAVGGGGRNILVGGSGIDVLFGGPDSDILIGGTVTLSTGDLVEDVLSVWAGNQSYAQRVAALQPVLAPAVVDDGVLDGLAGFGNKDWIFAGPEDETDAKSSEIVN